MARLKLLVQEEAGLLIPIVLLKAIDEHLLIIGARSLDLLRFIALARLKLLVQEGAGLLIPLVLLKAIKEHLLSVGTRSLDLLLTHRRRSHQLLLLVNLRCVAPSSGV